MMRRRALVTAIATTGLAGCSAMNKLPFTGTEYTTSNGNVVRFERAVTDDVSERCEYALERAMTLMDESLSDDIRVDLTTVSQDGYNHPIEYGQIAATAPESNLWLPNDIQIPGALGRYNPEDRVVLLADPSEVPPSLFGNTDELSTVAFDDYPTEPFLAHEFAHAIQHDTVQRVANPTSTDGEDADRSVWEGTAEYIRRQYRVSCSGNADNACSILKPIPRIADVPLWLVPSRLRYHNGMGFVHEALQRGGWDLLWDQHRTPPKTAAAIMFPGLFFEDGMEYHSIDPHPEGDNEWRRFQSSRMGVNYLYVLFVALGIVPLTGSTATVSNDLTAKTAIEHVFRNELLREWRGDCMTQYINEDNKTSYYWKTAWTNRHVAQQIANAVGDAYAEQGRKSEGGWQVGQDKSEVFVNVQRSGDEVIFGMAPTAEDLRQIL